jgi:hypothetical protein
MKTLFLLAAIAIGTYVVTTAASSPVYACGGVGSPPCSTTSTPDPNAPTQGSSPIDLFALRHGIGLGQTWMKDAGEATANTAQCALEIMLASIPCVSLPPLRAYVLSSIPKCAEQGFSETMCRLTGFSMEGLAFSPQLGNLVGIEKLVPNALAGNSVSFNNDGSIVEKLVPPPAVITQRDINNDGADFWVGKVPYRVPALTREERRLLNVLINACARFNEC